jgi:hypothetical protein
MLKTWPYYQIWRYFQVGSLRARIMISIRIRTCLKAEHESAWNQYSTDEKSYKGGYSVPGYNKEILFDFPR